MVVVVVQDVKTKEKDTFKTRNSNFFEIDEKTLAFEKLKVALSLQVSSARKETEKTCLMIKESFP